MYVTRPLSMYRRDPKSLSLPPPEGPNSGYLVVFDDESESYTCFGLCKRNFLWNLPFPQNKSLCVEDGDYSVEALFIPALNKPLSSHRYYAMVVQRGNEHQGKAYTSSREEDMSRGWFGGTYAKDVKPRPLDPTDTYQQFKILNEKDWGFSAKSIASDGVPPKLLSQKWWSVQMETPRHYRLLDDARGLDSSLRRSLPPLASRQVVGKWYCPYMFVMEEGMTLKEQTKKSMFYAVTLEQRWEKIFECNKAGGEKTVVVNAVVETEDVRVAGRRAFGGARGSERAVYFKSSGQYGKGEMMRVGLSMEVVERIKWEQMRVGWVSGDCERKVRVERVEECFDGIIWTTFGCYVLVESFVFKRMDSSVVLTYDFKHTHQIRCKWD